MAIALATGQWRRTWTLPP